MSKPPVLFEFVAKQNMIKNTRSHQNSLTRPHSQRENVVRIGALTRAHHLKDFAILLVR